MLRFLIGRILSAIPVIFGVVTLSFLILHMLPGDPVTVMLARSGATPDQIEALREELGLNLPLFQQYLAYLGNVLTGDFGRSIVSSTPVIDMVMDNLPPTLLLTSLAMAVAVPVGIVMGALAGVLRNSWLDRFVMAFTAVSVSMPAFWIGLMLVMLFAVQLGWLPAAGQGSPEALILPVLALSLGAISTVARATRTNILDALKQDYILTARAQGKSDAVILFRHALPNALVPVVTMIGLQFGWLFSGAFFIEAAFSRKGLGTVLVDAINGSDFPLVQGAVLFTALFYVVLNILVDLAYALIDPKIRFD
ncbi:ABC transporter permease [Marinibacterium sp. SX1]|uniref:ABC transporter permease n=1 Tax=Marinibacterium sp. SX1 TaxID=3388424 RepID=UPI003D168E63